LTSPNTKLPSEAVILYRFGPYEADLTRNELRKFGLPIRLERKPWQLLVALLGHPGELASRNELQKLLWPEGVFVDFETGLSVAVRKVRSALSDSAEKPKYIETVAGEGYRFVAPVEHVFATKRPVAVTLERGPSTMVEPPAIPDQLKAPPPGFKRQKSGFSNRMLFAALVIVAVILFGGARFVRRIWPRPEAAHPGKIMLVVLPFENLSGDPRQDYLSDGMTEELSGRLGNLSPQQLGVIGRTSAMTYKHSPRTISQIGQELGVGYVLEGSVRRDGSNLRITAQLVEVSDQAHVWASNYDRNMRNLLQVEDEIASSIAQQVGLSIALEHPTKLLDPHIPDAEAHEAYLLARYYWYERTPAGWKTGEQYFRRAIEKDPLYADAYAGLAECRIPKDEALAAARKAVQLDPGSAEAQTALAWVELYRELDLPTAERVLKAAVQLDPNYAPAHHTYGEYLEMVGRYEESIREGKQAVVLDPLAPVFRAALADVLSMVGQNQAAIAQLKLVIQMDPNFSEAHQVLGDIYGRLGMYKDAVREYQSSQISGDKPFGALAYAYARLGNRAEALNQISDAQRFAKRSDSPPPMWDLALAEAGLGNDDQALSWLEKLYEQHEDDALLWLKVEPKLAPLRSAPRFQNLIRHMKFPS
jgi:TolB-like protein/DNA-binding winged helix-turn-helix (wHTH) protein/thioredoxin-like negative regulator of GroEL